MNAGWRLESLLVENFRSISGKWEIPLSADVILVHGPNGAGKTSLLSALELAATGKIGFLETDSAGGASPLVNRHFPLGRVELTLRQGSELRVGGYRLDSQHRTGEPALSSRERLDFIERCFLPQTVLGRLLETYSAERQSESALVRFVKELAGIDDLDSLIDGLHAAGHLARTRSVSKGWARLEGSIAELQSQHDAQSAARAIAKSRLESSIDELRNAMGRRPSDTDSHELLAASARDLVRSLAPGSAELALLEGRKVRLDGILLALGQNDEATPEQEAAALAVDARLSFESWESTEGGQALATLNSIRESLGSTPTTATRLFDAFEETRQSVQQLVQAQDANQVLFETQREQAEKDALEIAKIDADLVRMGVEVLALPISTDVRSLIDVLQATLPLVHDDECPICGQGYPGGAARLLHHIQEQIASLSEAATEYARLVEVVGQLQAQKATIESRLQTMATSAPATPAVEASGFIRALNAIEGSVTRGRQLLQSLESLQARVADISARASILAAGEQSLVDLLAELGADRREEKTVDRAKDLEKELEFSIQEARFQVALSNKLQVAIAEFDDHRRQLEVMSHETEKIDKQLGAQRKQLSEALSRKAAANQLRLDAERARVALLDEVFDTALNQTWADFFTRFIPTEPFVPQFKKQDQGTRSIDVSLETVLPDGQMSGPPSSVLSFGNANTAALSLFLALHVSAPTAPNWLIFDDPVQSMDDIHVANFASVIRQLTLAQQSQVVIAVHQRELFDYLSFELAPASFGATLVKVSLDRAGEISMIKSESIDYSGDNDILISQGR